MEDVLYTVKEVAKLLKCNTQLVYRLRDAGLLKFIKLGQYKVRHTTLMKFLETYEGKDITDPENIKDL